MQKKSKLKFYKILKKIKLKCLQIIYNTKASHIGSIFSCMDIILYLI